MTFQTQNPELEEGRDSEVRGKLTPLGSLIDKHRGSPTRYPSGPEPNGLGYVYWTMDGGKDGEGHPVRKL